MENNKPCVVEVQLSPDANVDEVERAINDALRSRWTDLSRCKKTSDEQITINVKFIKPVC